MLHQPEDHRRTPPLAMALDHDNSLWTIGHGIRRFANGRWTTVESGPDWSTEGAYSLLIDQDRRLWAAAPTGVWRLDRDQGRFEKISHVGGGLALAPEGTVWLLGQGGGPSVRLAESISKRPRPQRSAAVVSRNAGLFASDGTLWALSCPETACLVHDVSGRGADLRPARDADERVASADGARGQETVTALEDREGNIWIRAHNGLNQFRPKRFLVPSPRMELGDFFYTAAKDGAGRVWISEAASGKLWRLGPDNVPVAEPGSPVFLVASGRDGTLLKADRRTITRVSGEAVESIPLPPGPDGKPIDRQLMGLLDDGKRIWTVAMDTGAIAWSDGKWQPSSAFGIPNGNILVEAGGPGQLWMARVNGELVLFDEGKLTRYDARLVGIATGIFPGQQLVIGGTDGLALLKGDKLQRLRSADPDVLRGVSGIAVTANGDRWLNGLHGVVHVHASDWQRAVERPDEPLRYELFGAIDGYPGRSGISWRRQSALSADGRHAWFIASKGIVGLDSNDLRRNVATPQPVVVEVATDSARMDTMRQVRLAPGSQSFRIRFTAPSLRQPERTRFEFRLDGFDTGWRDAGYRRTTSYTNVAPGDYVFRVRAFNEDGVVSKEEAAVPITIEPTFVQSLPFKIAVAAALVALLALLYHLRVRHLTRRITERVEITLAERERIARTLHDSFLQTVYLLLLRLRKFEKKLPEGEGVRQELRTILEDTQTVLDEGRDQVHELRVDDTRVMEDAVRECADSLRALHPDIRFDLHKKGRPGAIEQVVADEAGAIACEAVRNAFSHARARNIVVEIVYGPRAMTLTVRDDGAGIEADVLARGTRGGHWGLVGMRERAVRIKAQLDIRSVPGEGTVVSLAVPLSKPIHAASH